MGRPIAALVCAAFVLAGCQTLFGSKDEHPTDDAHGAHRTATVAAPVAPPHAARPAAANAPMSPEVAAYMDKEEADLRARLLAVGVSVTRQGERIVITMDSDATFTPPKSDQVQPQFYQVLASIGEVLTRYDRTSIEVTGHVDSAAAGAHGQPLTRRQAGAVAAVLKQHGVAQTRLKAEGLGKAKPVASNATSAGRAKNRRVEIQITPA